MLETIGLVVSRTLPAAHLVGIASGSLSVHGGVIRDAGGRIVAHLATSAATTALTPLLPGADILLRLIEQGQLVGIARDVRRLHASVAQVLNVATAGTLISGLGVVATIAGVAYLGHKLGQVATRLAKVERDVGDLKVWSETLQRAELRAAIDALRHAGTTDDPATRRELLFSGKRDLSTLSHFYADRWAAARDAAEAETVNELAALAMLGHAAACSDLGLGHEAAADFTTATDRWIGSARRHTRDLLFGDAPARLLARQYADVLPTRTLVGLLDFAHDQDRGIDWIDELRQAPDRPRNWREIFGSEAALPDGVVDLCRGIRGRADILAATVAHYDFLDTHRIGATQFAAALNQALVESDGEAICVHAAV